MELCFKKTHKKEKIVFEKNRQKIQAYIKPL